MQQRRSFHHQIRHRPWGVDRGQSGRQSAVHSAVLYGYEEATALQAAVLLPAHDGSDCVQYSQGQCFVVHVA